MTRKMLIDATHAEETRVVVVDGNKVEEFDFESLNKRQLAGNIYLAKVTRVEPSLQAAFVEYGGNRHGFLAFSEIHPDYYQIPKADREALLAEEAEYARQAEEEAAPEKPKSRGRSRSRSRSKAAAEGTPAAEEAVITAEAPPPAEPETIGADFEDVPPPSAASGEIDIEVVEEPAEAAAAAPGPEADAEPEAEAETEYEAVGGDDLAEERAAPRKPRQRRYKIQEVIKVRQILLVQVVKEERGNKGAALTTYLSLAGRYCVLMPNTARGGGISRKITNATDRKKLKDISSSITVPEGAGLIIRTAGANRTKTEIKRDYEYLLRQWEVIRDLTLKSIAPCLIYEEGSLIKRAIRDLYSRDIEEVLVDGERGYREAKDYMRMLMPSHAKNVKHYSDPLPLFSRFQVESYLAGMFNPVVQLKSGGYIVIDVTEALVAIDVNSGRATREASIEETALKTNMEAAEEAARQMRLRDLAGLIVIDFIDMDERRNNAAVEKKLKEKLKSDRARIQVGRISGFGLLEMSRQRLRPGMIEATTKGCPHCHGTGRVRSDDSIALALLRELEEEGVRARSREVLIAAPVEIANYLLNQKREHIAMIEGRFGLSVRVEGDPALISPDYRLERFKTASRIVQVQEGLAPSPVAYPEEDEIEEEAEEGDEAEAATGAGAGAGEKSAGKRKRRRRRRGGAGRSGAETPEETAEEQAAAPEADAEAEPAPEAAAPAEPAEPAEAVEPAAKPKSRRRSRGSRSERPAAETSAETSADTAAETPAEPESTSEETRPSPLGEVIETGEPESSGIVEVPESDAPQPRRRERVRRPVAAVLADVEAPLTQTPAPETPEDAAAPGPEDLPEPHPAEAPTAAAEAASGETMVATETRPETAQGTEAAADPDAAPEKEGQKRRGWWSRAIGGS
ncbi:MAG TPA: ribonuclease E/G [Amaricoccus sp.]|uniref:Rne/Rng family ribonuclease n=1 Tax=Amaricoccus sp. TaxID=1872485 RepID=UPI002B5F40E3|nr:ribonuclease E/G [Amaricoccus sp.]HMQ94570.1 ribonuclease E/G [Amaricoccus sp.]HMR52967.1 ribonuclease E/G [Amaricoccus sp.]HMR60983.1 ribonuclease E/G [Amaricoccus sp.]HMT99888.1 ribonuclease E/G [Amaricoccus sp.]